MVIFQKGTSKSKKEQAVSKGTKLYKKDTSHTKKTQAI